MTVSADGSILAHYRKTHLYMTDETWAKPSPKGWLTASLTIMPKTQPEITVKASFGICMDLNPHKFEAPWGAYEFASHALASQADILILSMAWLSNSNSSAPMRGKADPDVDTLSYWIERLRPLVMADKEVLVVCANRCGWEPGRNPAAPDLSGGVRYAGSSWMGKVGKNRVRIWDIMDREQEDLLVVDTAEEPKWNISMTAGADDKLS